MNSPEADGPQFLFVPLFGGGGTGEFVRSLALAKGLQEHTPQARIAFVLPQKTEKDLLEKVPFPTLNVAAGATQYGGYETIEQCLQAVQPRVAVFDSGVRSHTLRTCKRLGIAVAYISDRAGTLRKIFRLDMVGLVQLHIHQREHLTRPAFSRWQQFLARFTPARRIICDAIFPIATSATGVAITPALGELRVNAPFVLWSPGGGGYCVDGVSVGDLFIQAASNVRAQTGIQCLVVLGPAYPHPTPVVPGLTIVRYLEQTQLYNLLTRASAGVLNGGTGLHIALCAGLPCVVAPLGGDDQPERIALYSDAGFVLAAAPNVESLATQTTRLLRDSTLHERTSKHLASYKVSNGFNCTVETIAQLALS